MKGKAINQKDIVDGLRKGSSKEIKYLYKLVKPKVRTYILKKGGLDSEINDIFQEAIIATSRKLLEKDTVITQIENYIFTACIHEWSRLNNLKKKETDGLDGYIREHKDDVDDPNIEEKKSQIQKKTFLKAFGALKLDCRRLFKLSSKDYSSSEIAANLNVSVEYVKTKRARCRKHFMDIFNSLKNK